MWSAPRQDLRNPSPPEEVVGEGLGRVGYYFVAGFFSVFFLFLMCFSLESVGCWLSCLFVFLSSWLLVFLSSWLLGFLASWLLGFLASCLLGFLPSWLLDFLASWLCRLQWFLGLFWLHWLQLLVGFISFIAFSCFLASLASLAFLLLGMSSASWLR